jgi:hypothetical protein
MFGSVAALDADTLLVAAALPDSDGANPPDGDGQVVIYVRDGTTWNLEATLVAPVDIASGRASFGRAIDVAGDTAVIGMPDADTAFVFTRAGGTWELQARWDGHSYSGFGGSVAIDGDTVIVGAPLEDFYPEISDYNSGAAHVFVRSGSAWARQARLARGGPPLYHDEFGSSVAISRNLAAVGAPEDDSHREDKVVVLFVRDGTTWEERETVRPDLDGDARYFFAASIALHGQVLAVGSTGWWMSGDTVTVTERSVLDEDEDALPDAWESLFGLAVDATDSDASSTGDPDHDGLTNAQELAAGTHPRGSTSATRYLAEGAIGSFFDTWIAIANPGQERATVLMRFLAPGGWTTASVVEVPALSVRRVHVNDVPGVGPEAFSTIVESDRLVVVEREMGWDRVWLYGSHSDTAVAAPSTIWYFAEGATHATFDLFYLLQNPSDTPADVTVTYLRPAPLPPLTRTHTVPAQSRFNIWVDTEPGLEATDVSAIIETTNGVPIIAERAMYTSAPGRPFAAGHEAAGVTALSSEWIFAEGATGPYFDLFLLVANPTSTVADVRARYLLPDGTVVIRTHPVAPHSRFTILVDQEGLELADTAVSTVVTSTNGVPIVVERAMWWPGPTAATWAEAHAVAGVTAAGTRWVVAGGLVGAPSSDPPAEVTIHAAIDEWTSAPVVLEVTLGFADGSFARKAGGSPGPDWTVTLNLHDLFPESVGRPFAAYIRSRGRTLCYRSCFFLDPVALTVENGRPVDARGYEWLSDGPEADTYFLVANLAPESGTIRVTLLFEDGAGPSRTFPIDGTSRLNVDVRFEFPEAVGRVFGAVVESLGPTPVPLVVERATYANAQGQAWAAGSAAAGTIVP